MEAGAWLQLGLGGAALFVLLFFSAVLYRVVMRAIAPLEHIAKAIEGVRAELGGVRERVSRIEGKLDSHFDWTPVETPRPNLSAGYYSHVPKRPKTDPGR